MFSIFDSPRNREKSQVYYKKSCARRDSDLPIGRCWDVFVSGPSRWTRSVLLKFLFATETRFTGQLVEQRETLARNGIQNVSRYESAR